MEQQTKLTNKRELEKIDTTKYIGRKAKIVIAEIRKMAYGHVLYLESEVIEVIKGNSKDIELSATKIIGLTEKDGDVFIGIGTKADEFMSKHGLDLPDYEELIGKEIIVQTNDKGYLTFN